MRRGGGGRKRKGQKPKISTRQREIKNTGDTGDGKVENVEDQEENKNENQNQNRAVNPNECLKYNFWALWFICWLNIFPLSYDTSTGIGKMRRKCFWRKIIFYCWPVLITLKQASVIIMAVVLALSLKKGDQSGEEQSKVYDLSVLFVASVAFTIILYLYFCIPVFGDMETVLIAYNSVITSESELTSFRNEDEKKRKTLRELLLMYLPFGVYSIVPCVTAFMIVRPHNPGLLTSLIVDQIKFRPDDGLTFFLFSQWCPLLLYILFGLLDHIYVFFNVAIIHYGVFKMFLFIERMKQKTVNICDFLRSEDDGIGIFERISTTVRLIQMAKLQLILFNQSLSLVVFCTKLIALTAAIVGGFGAVKLFESNPMFAIIFLNFFVEGNVIHFILFDSAYQIGENLEALKGEILTKTGLNPKIGQQHERKIELNREMRSIQELGIKSGAFNNMERESTLLFSDFSVGQVVDLLITF